MKKTPQKRPKLAISIGDINGIGLELLLTCHKKISKFCEPYYFIHKRLLKQGLKKLDLHLDDDFHIVEFDKGEVFEFKEDKSSKKLRISSFISPIQSKSKSEFSIQASKIDKNSGLYSFLSFQSACYFTQQGFAKALITLPIHKKAWQLANIDYKGHTGALSDFFKQDAIMMLGCSKLFVALFTEHIPLNEVSKRIQIPALTRFLINFYTQTHFKNIGVLGFNPHAGDYGAIGGAEEEKMRKAVQISNVFLNLKENHKNQNFLEAYFEKNNDAYILEKLLKEPKIYDMLYQKMHIKHFYIPEILVADTAFSKASLKHCNRLVSMYHDLGLAPLKALYFEKSVNISLNLPIIRTSVDHGTAFDKAYKNAKLSTKSYEEAVKSALKLIKTKHSSRHF
ncbi:4-hydroxythreonine-4-phosphate dehydrogenase [Campylobacter sp. MIT 12-8780]|uniref:4-hydroxythreonine-4-phosphate dehydrogenase n=1 Tax=unclassified Campylobacter TaxID=2593542 RepID=UPI00115CE19A|nr:MULTISPECIES: 4-hydroxythreonine-4-phosphate dehydrogenase [unclassified Campylobacter]NDJ28124.1 4-hydroxythreonine-4-phosphate dehydrogenase [Campylobacter sp. MIT 19-121]TQR42331.1 4-hydroxythreonine-4-phosphate dehydrogenase [Campylobacter sp. MIT 12-8780]